MPQPRKIATKATPKRAPIPMPYAAEEVAKNTQDTVQLTHHAGRMASGVKPTLWHRIWYGAQAERKLMEAQAKPVTTMQAPLDEVKAGVLAEMQNMSRVSGGVTGSPFANVMLPQGARVNTKTASTTVLPRRATPGVPLFKLAILAVLMLLGYALWHSRNTQVAGLMPTELVPLGGDVIATGESATQPGINAPKETVIEWAKPKETAATHGKAVVGAVQALKGNALVVALPQRALPTAAVVQNQTNVVWLSTGLINTTESPLRDVRLNVVVRDHAGVVLMQREMVVAGPVAAGQILPPQRVVLDSQTPERFVAQVPLGALRVSITPLAANTSL
jgi:hypothetical protein